MNRLIFTLLLIGGVAGAQTVVNQGAPGRQGPWPVTIVTGSTSGGGGGGGPVTGTDGGPVQVNILSPIPLPVVGADGGSVVVIPPSLAANVYGAVQVATTATAIPSSAAAGRTTLTVQNLGPNRICCGWSNAVTASTGLCIAAATLDANGLPQNGSAQFNVGGGKSVYCISAVLQVSPADTRYSEE